MRSLFITILLFGLPVFEIWSQNVAINTTGVVANGSSILDVSASDKGLLIPRVALTGTADVATIAAPAVSLLVYNTSTVSDVTPGFYYWGGASWMRLATGTNTANSWNILGNSGTVNGTHFIGTTDLVPLNFRVNNEKAGMIDAFQGNTFLGHHAGNVNTGLSNSGFGSSALQANTTGQENVACGVNTLSFNTIGNGNVAIGVEALLTNIAGSNATAIGYEAMRNANNQSTSFTNSSVAVGYQALQGTLAPVLNTGNYNTAIGYQAIQNIQDGSQNTGVGYQTLQVNTSGNSNTAIGNFSLHNNLTGSNNVAVGYEALFSNRAGSEAVAIGHGAMRNAYDPVFAFANTNVAIGSEALKGSPTPSANTGANNTAVGYWAMQNNSTGFYNTSVGTMSLVTNTSGYNNTAIGTVSLYTNTTGYDNIALGDGALYYNTIGNKNSALGTSSLWNNVGDYNTACGYNALYFNTTGDYNTALGYNANVSSPTLTNTTAIGSSATVYTSNSIQFGDANVVALYTSGNQINKNPALAAINATGTANAADIVSGYITSTSPAPITITLPTATQVATQMGGTVSRGTSLYFTVDNSAGSNTITIALGAGITATTPAILGGATLTISPPNSIALFRLVFTSSTTAKIFRIH